MNNSIKLCVVLIRAPIVLFKNDAISNDANPAEKKLMS